MTGRIGYYVHHHGDGHRRRALAIAAHAPDDYVLLGTGLSGRTGNVACIDLPDDRSVGVGPGEDADDAATRPSSMHYLPTDHDGIRRRVALVADWIAAEKPSLLVVDVSVEIAMLARIAATPTVYVRLSGVRADTPHLEAFRGARAILAPFHRDLDEPGVVSWVQDKSRYCPGLTLQNRAGDSHDDVVLVVFGKGGAPGDYEAVAKAAAATPAIRWRVIGPVTAPSCKAPSNLSILGWVENAEDEIAAAGVVVGAAGDGLVTAVLAANRPLICLAEPRPFSEQISKARRLDALGAAISLRSWPAARQWPVLLADARALSPATRSRLHDPRGAATADAFLHACADGAGLRHSSLIGMPS
ncbi:MAG: glycosyltransferase [Bosea sp. (in: a-proteobacteria)]